MKTNNTIKRTFLFHPILFGLYPVLALYVFNRNEIVIAAIQQAVITSFIITFTIISLSLLVFKSWEKAAASASLTLLLFYSYGHIYDFVKNVSLFGEIIGRDRYLVPFWILLFILGQFLLLRAKKNTLNEMLNSVSLFLMIFVFIQILIPLLRFGSVEANSPEDAASVPDNVLLDSADRDVYYILVDAYSRQDLLQEKLELDTSNFIAGLKDLGFYIPACAQSNYDNTLLSMTATLNMNYLDALDLKYEDDKAKYKPYIRENLVMGQFKDMGYSVATFKSLFYLLDLPNETYYYDYFKDGSVLNSQASLNFQYLFLQTTFVRPLMEFIDRNHEIALPLYLTRWIPTGNTVNSDEYRQYQQSVFALDSLQKMPDLPEKKFIYAHLYITHQPYVFNPDGSFHPFLKQSPSAYRDQVIFANTRLLEIVESILAKSDPAPIIVIQSDHSYFRSADRVKILNAYYFPENQNNTLYDTVTPVNTFRVIFNTYFGGQYNLLPDVSRYSEKDGFHETPSTCVE